jgi:hypothetical protein
MVVRQEYMNAICKYDHLEINANIVLNAINV